MNVLPLISVFIILFALGSYTFFHSVKATFQENFHYKGALAVERAFASNVQEEFYESQNGKASDEKEETESKKNENKAFESHRDNLKFPESSKLNIRHLFTDEGNPLLEKVALTLLRELYQDTTIYTPDLEREVLHLIVATAKVHPSINSFEELLMKLPDSKVPLFYKLIKGTQIYKLKTRQGYPPLGDFISLDGKSNKRKSINFYKAKRPVLSALFGETLTGQIIGEEKRKWEAERKKFLTREQLQAFLAEKCRRNYTEFEPLLYFDSSAQKSSQEMVGSEESKLQIRISL